MKRGIRVENVQGLVSIGYRNPFIIKNNRKLNMKVGIKVDMPINPSTFDQG